MLRLASMENASKLTDTDLCVMCGMCLPLCPTYQLYQTETESPRGRIALMQAIDQQRIKADPVALLHIDHCLGCLNCESICPSKVPYGKLIDEFRTQFNQRISKPYLSKFILRQSTKPGGLNSLASIAGRPVLKQLTQLASTVTKLPKHLAGTPPSQIKNFYAGVYSEPGKCRGEVSLFTGCIGKSSDFRSIRDTILIINQLGFDVSIPQQELCCGALHQHNGQLESARQLLDKNQLQLKHQGQNQKANPVLYLSPACGSSLMQIDDVEVIDVRTFILNEIKHQPLEFAKSIQAIALHESCSHRNMLKLKTLNTDLLNCIPGIRIIESSNPSLCCGAGGLQSINYPEQARALLQEKLKSFDLLQTNILISDNIGCSLHIKSAISGYNQEIEVMHPVSFLARQLTTTR